MLVRTVCQQLRSYAIKVGDRVSVRRKITADDVKVFADLTKDYNPIHSSPEKGIVHGALLNGLVSGVIGTALPGFGTVVVEQSLRFPKPCYAGDEVTIEVTVKSVRKIIEVDFEVTKGDESNDVIVLEGKAKLLMPFLDVLENSRQETNDYGHDYIKK